MNPAFLTFIILAIMALTGMAVPVRAAECPVDTERLLQLTPDAFDQDRNGGWRTLASRTGCEKAAADLIKTYIARNWGRIDQGSLHILYWHAGQLQAQAGDGRLAIPLLMAGVAPDQRRLDMGFHEYALGTIAFLNGDLAGLKAARQRLSVLPQPDTLKAEFKDHWPPNLGVLDGLIRCFGSSYAIAYGNDCPKDQAGR